MIKGIVAVDRNWAIGKIDKETKKGDLLFKLKEDMENFKCETMNKIVVMGENTLLSFPKQKPLKNRTNIVLCPEGHEYVDCYCIHNFTDLVNLIIELSKTTEVYIIGGGMMYRSMLPYYDEILVTKVDAEDPAATVFFPNLDKDDDFYISNETETIEDNGYNIKFVLYERV